MVSRRIPGRSVSARLAFGNKLCFVTGNNEEVGVVVTLSPLYVLELLGCGHQNRDATGSQKELTE